LLVIPIGFINYEVFSPLSKPQSLVKTGTHVLRVLEGPRESEDVRTQTHKRASDYCAMTLMVCFWHVNREEPGLFPAQFMWDLK